ncbi:MAG: GNAT family N-acetyltransferase [Actinobacteria bacterium HGW-Actinobacteria-2]|nr:MAG: GNAT family N-acetyltransferase [Actinobacteria bacterium HGW-Actinobacteria-2]
MSTFHLVEANADQEKAIGWVHRFSQLISIEIHGEDQAGSLESTRLASTDASTRLNGIVLALPGPAPAGGPVGRFGLPHAPEDLDDVWGVTTFQLPLKDNLHLIDNAFVQVRADRRRLGVGTAMVSHLRRAAELHGRNTVVMWSDHRPGAEVSDWVDAPQGTGRVPRDPATRFALSQGFQLAQVERQSRLFLPVDLELLAALSAEARAAAEPGYRLVSWSGPTPTEYLDAVAAANHAISADAPNGEIDWEPEQWDAARVQEADERLARSGTAFHTLALSDSGEPAGLTTIFVERGEPNHGYQFNTVVLGRHRGHRLGLWLKTTNLAAVVAAHPELPHLDTWNADENGYMLAINVAMGFRVWSIGGGWQRVLA